MKRRGLCIVMGLCMGVTVPAGAWGAEIMEGVQAVEPGTEAQQEVVQNP